MGTYSVRPSTFGKCHELNLGGIEIVHFCSLHQKQKKMMLMSKVFEKDLKGIIVHLPSTFYRKSVKRMDLTILPFSLPYRNRVFKRCCTNAFEGN